MIPDLPITLRPSLVRNALLFVASLLFVVGGVWMVRAGRPLGYLCAGFFALGVVVFGIQFHPGAAYLKLDAEGFTFCTVFRPFTLRWADIAEFGVSGVALNRLVSFNYTPEYQKAARARAISKAVSGFEGALPDTYGMKAEDLAGLMEALRREFWETQGGTDALQ